MAEVQTWFSKQQTLAPTIILPSEILTPNLTKEYVMSINPEGHQHFNSFRSLKHGYLGPWALENCSRRFRDQQLRKPATCRAYKPSLRISVPKWYGLFLIMCLLDDRLYYGTSYLGVPQWDPNFLNSSFTLGAAYPNSMPFGPKLYSTSAAIRVLYMRSVMTILRTLLVYLGQGRALIP